MSFRRYTPKQWEAYKELDYYLKKISWLSQEIDSAIYFAWDYNKDYEYSNLGYQLRELNNHMKKARRIWARFRRLMKEKPETK